MQKQAILATGILTYNTLIKGFKDTCNRELFRPHDLCPSTSFKTSQKLLLVLNTQSADVKSRNLSKVMVTIVSKQTGSQCGALPHNSTTGLQGVAAEEPEGGAREQP